MKKDLTKKKKGIGKWIALGVVAVIAVFVIWIVSSTKKAMKTVSETLASMQTGTVTTRTLTKSVGATGTIKSVDKRDLDVSLAGVDVSKINVEVGDEVTEGQLLVTFDTSKIEENLADAEESLENALAQSKITTNGVARSFNDTQRAADFSIDSAKTGVDKALESYEDAKKSLEDARNQYNENSSWLNEDQEKLNSLDAQIKEQEESANKKAKKLKEASAAYTAAILGMEEAVITDGESRGWDAPEEAAIKALYDAVKSAKKGNDKAVSALTELKTSRASAQANYDYHYSQCTTLNSLIEKYDETVKTLKDSYDSSVKTYDNTVANQQSAIASARDSVASNKITQSTASKTYEKQVETYEEQLKDGSLYSPISGVVTAINLKEGDTYQAGTVITVQDTSEFIIEAEITEYDIADVKKGQKVLIKTDATGDEEMEGTVTFVSPVATASVANTSPTYTVKVSINDPSDRLRLDMSASLSIIIDQHENAMTVPYNAVGKDEEGKTFVVRTDKTTFETETIYVTVLMESNYYTEISSDKLKEGDELQIIDSGEVKSIWELMIGDGVY